MEGNKFLNQMLYVTAGCTRCEIWDIETAETSSVSTVYEGFTSYLFEGVTRDKLATMHGDIHISVKTDDLNRPVLVIKMYHKKGN